VYIRGRLVVG